MEFDCLYSAQMGFATRTLRWFGVREEDLHDVAQEVFLVAWTKLHTYDRARHIRPWLGGIARRVASDYRRKPGYRRIVVPEDPRRLPESVDPGPDAEERLAAWQTLAMLRDALEKLDQPRREVLELHDLHEIPIETIASAQDVPVPTAWSRLRSARLKMSLAMRRLCRLSSQPPPPFAKRLAIRV